MHGNTGFKQAVQLIHQLARKAVFHHCAAHFGVGSVYGNVQRRHVRFNNAVKIFVLHIGKGYKIAVQKRKAVIVITHIKPLAHTGYHLVYKAENAFIVTGCYLVEHGAFKLQPQVFIYIFGYLHFALIACGIQKCKFHFLIRQQKA